MQVEITGNSAAVPENAQSGTGSEEIVKSGLNLATVLADFSGENAADRVTVADQALIPDGTVTEGEYLSQGGAETETLTADLPAASAGTPLLRSAAPMLKSSVISSGYKFSREGISDYAASNYWHDWEFFAGKDSTLDSSSAADYADLFTVSPSDAITVLNVTQTSPLDCHMTRTVRRLSRFRAAATISRSISLPPISRRSGPRATSGSARN